MHHGYDGEAFLAARLGWVAERGARGERPLAVFDLDNTVFDTRPRTLAAARAFDAEAGTQWFQALTVLTVRRDGRATAAQPLLGPPPAPVVDAFAAYWDEAFWRPEAFVHDAPVEPIVAWVVAAIAAGAEVRFLTGRIADLHDPTLAALRRIGLDVDPSAVACKPDLATRTAPWKRDMLAAWARAAPIAWYVTEGRRDTAALQATEPRPPCVLIDCSFEDPDVPVAPGTPLLPRIF